jgi:hypothetical protein
MTPAISAKRFDLTWSDSLEAIVVVGKIRSW